MSKLPPAGDIEIESDLTFQRRSWVIQRIGWGVLAASLTAALFGFCGPGVVSSTTAGTADTSLQVEYDRFERSRSPATFRLLLGPNVARQGKVRIWIDRPFLDGLSIDSVVPQPDQVAAAGDRIIWTFALAEPSQPTGITFNFISEQFGLRPGQAGIVDGESLSFWQFVYP